MGRLRTFLRALAGKPALKARPRRHGRMYEAAKLGAADGLHAGLGDANAEIFASLDAVRRNSRKLYQDNPYYRRIVDALVNAIVSTGIRPTIDVGDTMTRDPRTGKQIRLDTLVYELWEEWGRVCVPGSKMTIYGLQQLMCRQWVMDGESLARIRPRYTKDMPGLPPVKIQPIESDLLLTDKNETVGNSLHRIYAGVEYDAIGELAAYHLLREHPGASYPFAVAASRYDTIRVPASEIVHLFRAERANQVRGMPLASAVIVALYDLDGYMHAVRVGTRAAAAIVATVKGGNEDQAPDGLVVTGEDGEPVETEDDFAPALDQNGNPLEFLAGAGNVLYAPDGKEIQVHTPQPPQGVAEFVSACLHEIAAGAAGGMSYHVLSGDMSDSSFAQAKLGLIEQARNVSVLREATFCPIAMDPLWRAWVNAGIAAGLFPDDRRLYAAEWSQPKQQSADQLQDAKANILRLQAGAYTLTEWIESEGRDPDKVFRQRQRDRELCEKYGVVSLGDLSQVSMSGVVQNIITEDEDKP